MRAAQPTVRSQLLAFAAVAGLVVACGGGGASPGPGGQPTAGGPTQAATAGAASVPPSTPAAGGVTDPCKLITNDEAAAIIGVPIVKTSTAQADATLDIWIGPLVGCGFLGAKAANGSTPSITVAIVPNGKDQFEQVKSKTPNVTAIAGVGDEAFVSDQGGPGKPPFLVGALKGTTAVYLYSVVPAQDGAMQTLLSSAVSRI